MTDEVVVEQQAATPAAPEETVASNPVESNPVQQQQERTYTKAEVQDLMKRRVDRSHKRVWDRYGVKSFEELDDILKDYKSIKDNYASLEARYNDSMRDISLLKNETLPEKRDDIIAYFKGNNLEFNDENLIKALTTHPEWVKPKRLVIETLGNEKTPNPGFDEKAYASQIFGTKI